MDNVFFFFAGVAILLFIQSWLKPERTIVHEYDEGVTRVVVQDFKEDVTTRTTIYGTDGSALFKRSWVGSNLCYSPLQAYFQASDEEVAPK